jgi:hypothetical protein
MAIKTQRSLIGTAEAAEILGVTQGRVRQLILKGPTGQDPVLWSTHLGDKILVVDENEVHRYGERMKNLRAAGKVRGNPPGGFKKDRPGTRKSVCMD